MSNFRLTQTGTELQADLNKVEGMAEIKSVGSGLSLSGEGELSASGGSGLPTIAVTQSQVIQQDPVQVQLTNEQYTAMNERSVIFDGTALGMTTVVADYIGSYTDDNDIKHLKFAFVYSESTDYLYFHTIFVNTSTKVAELQFDNTYPAEANHAYDVTLDKSDVGLGNVDNTSDLNKPISTATQTALNLKADKATTYTKDEVNNLYLERSSDDYSIDYNNNVLGIELHKKYGPGNPMNGFFFGGDDEGYESRFQITALNGGSVRFKTTGFDFVPLGVTTWTTIAYSDIETKTNTANTYAKKADVYTKAEVDSAIATAITGAINASY